MFRVIYHVWKGELVSLTITAMRVASIRVRFDSVVILSPD